MKKFLLLLNFSLYVAIYSFGQSGPGGVGNSSSNSLWLDASSISAVNGQAISTWNDISGNSNDFIQATTSQQPTFTTGVLNNRSVIRFDGSNDFFNATSNISDTDISVFMVANKTSITSDNRTLFFINKYLLLSRSNTIDQWGAWDGSLKSSGNTLGSSHTILSYVFRNSNTFLDLYNNSGGPVSHPFTSPYNRLTSLGANNNGLSTFSQFHKGDMAEIILFNTPLNTAQRIIVENYLGIKYGRTIANSRYGYGTTHNGDLAGIGREDASNLHSDAQGKGIVRINSASSLSDGEYLLFAHDNISISTKNSTDVPVGITERFARTWRVAKTGDPGTISISFDMTGLSLGSDNTGFVLLIDQDGIFSNATSHLTGMNYNAVTNILTFTNVNFNDGDYFSLGNNSITAIPSSTNLSQTGPGGVGNSSSNILWLDASSLTGLSNGQSVANWLDISGNSNNFTQATASQQPSYRTGVLNGKPVIRFDGSNDFFRANSNITDNDISIFMVANKTSTTTDHRTLFFINKYLIKSRTIGTDQWGAWDGSLKSSNTTLGSSHTILSVIFKNSNTLVDLFNNSNGPVSRPYSTPYNRLTTLGSNNNGSNTFSQFHTGDMAEVILYNTPLNIAQRIIVENYLASKYGNTIANDKYNFDATHGNEVAGIGRENASNYHVDAQGTGIVRINNSSNLNDGEYFLFGHNNTSFLINNLVDVPPSYIEDFGNRLERTWRVTETGELGTLNVSFDLTGIEFGDSSKYELLINANGIFASGTIQHVSGRSWNPSTKVLTFTDVNFTNGDYFTLGVVSGIISITNGLWSNVSTWNCNCIPKTGDIVVVKEGHTVTIDGTANARNININPTGILEITNSANFNLSGNFNNQGTFNAVAGTVNFYGLTLQTINSSGSTSFNNLTLNNTSGLIISSGSYVLTGALNILAGNFDNSANLPFTLISNSSATARIAPVADGSQILGNFIVQRYVSSRTANWANLAGPAISTIADWDAEIIMSNVGGNDGGYNPPWYSVNTYNETLAAYVPVTTTSYAITPTKGFELYLADNNQSLAAFTFDTQGVLNTGSFNANVTNTGDGWNLIGNPYASHVSWDNITKTNIDPYFYIFDAATGDYAIYGPGDEIAPSQALWIWASDNTSSLIFTESAKTATTGSLFRNAIKDELTLNVYGELNAFTGKTRIRVNNFALQGFDFYDARYRKSPEKGTPSIMTFAEGSNISLGINSISPDADFVTIPVHVKVDVSGEYTIEFNGMSNLYNYSCMQFEDISTGKIIDINSQSTYAFSANKEDNETRFKLHLYKEGYNCEEIATLSSVSKLNSSDGVTIRNTSEHVRIEFKLEQAEVSTINVYNLMGQKIIQPMTLNAFNQTVILSIPENTSSIYFISVTSENKNITKKINR